MTEDKSSESEEQDAQDVADQDVDPAEVAESETASEGDAMGEESSGSSIFDLFEPPPDTDSGDFGPIPVVDPDGSPDDISVVDDLVIEDDEPVTITDDSADEASADEASVDEASADEASADEASADEASADDEFASIYELLPDEVRAKPQEAAEVAPEPTGAAALPNWTDPPTGQVPKVVAGEDDGWADVEGPSWKGEGPDQGEADLKEVLGVDAIAPHSGATGISIDDDESVQLPPAAGAPQRDDVAAAAPRRGRGGPVEAAADELGERNIPQAILVGLIFAGLGLLAFALGTWTTLALIAAVAALGSVELFSTMRSKGLHPATLLGVTAAIAMPFAVESNGAEGFMMVSGLVIVFGAIWYLVGADTHKPTLNLGLTLLGVFWIGGMAAFGALIVTARDGISILLAAVVCTVFFDTAAFAGGKAVGRTPFHPASKNKTWEGTIIGVLGAIVGSFIVTYFLGVNVDGFASEWSSALLLGLVVGVLAPLGDLTESMIKRDLGVKDMGTLLPGHGGMLDRLDGLLFVLPGVYYLARILDYI